MSRIEGSTSSPSGDCEAASGEYLLQRYRAVRRFTRQLCEPLAPEDHVIQTMPEVSPAKWHLAHTSWFFETFLLKPNIPGHKPLHPQYAYLFNSYYNAAGQMHARPLRGLISRPTVDETLCYRRFVDEHVDTLLQSADRAMLKEIAPIVTLGLHHEQQHQELILTDIKHVFSANPIRPAYRTPVAAVTGQGSEPLAPVAALEWTAFEEGIHWIGYDGKEFAFDNERPRHRVFLEPFQLASRLVTNGEYLEFIEDGGYQRPELWLSLGWTTAQERGWEAPLYWEKEGAGWRNFTLGGMRDLAPDEPVCHVSYFEADAFAHWAGARLATEAEWETASHRVPAEGNFADAGLFHPKRPANDGPGSLRQMFGDLWEWTGSAYSAYPGYRPAGDALGEYNGKFMCNQYVLRGGSCATSKSHIRPAYRNFFPPDARWQFSGIRLAKS